MQQILCMVKGFPKWKEMGNCKWLPKIAAGICVYPHSQVQWYREPSTQLDTVYNKSLCDL